MNQEEDQKAVFQNPQLQKDLNTPLAKSGGLTKEEEEFLQMLLDFVDQGKINLYSPSSLLNKAYYDTLDEVKQGHVDLESMNILSAIRDIYGLCKAGMRETYQVENLVSRLKLSKERLEEVSGDVFII